MKRGFSPAGIAIFATVLLALTVGGVAIGWKIADTELAGTVDPLASASPSAGGSKPTVAVSASEPAASPSPTPAASPDGETMPNVLAVDFVAARRKIIDLDTHAQVVLKFDKDSTETPGKVLKTEPEPDEPIRRGSTITLTIAGEAPEILNGMPRVEGFTCQEAADRLLDAGLLIGEYPNGKNGLVEKSEPAWNAPVRWNERTKLYCGTTSESASPSAP